MHELNYLIPLAETMKMRPIIVLLLFVASAGVLVWIYIAATHEHEAPPASPMSTTLSDLDACSRRKHVKSIQYDHFAEIADQEHRNDASRLFRALALAERVQEGNCTNAMVRLGGVYNPPAKVVVFRGTTGNNLERSIAYERQSLAELHGEDINRAIANKNRYAARVLIWAAAGDTQHILEMQRCLNDEHHPEHWAQAYLVCPVCGNLYAADYLAPYCPQCLTGGSEFIRFE